MDFMRFVRKHRRILAALAFALIVAETIIMH
jgi:hypothetical protein